jgi:protein-disulfide isomerase
VTPVFTLLCRVCILFALAASGALYVQYLNPAASPFCGLSSGCEAVRRSGFTYLGSPLLSIPLVGLLAYGTVFFCSIRGSHRATFLLTAAGGLVAALLVAVQAFYVHAFCWLCLVVDSSAILAAVFALLDDRARRAAGRAVFRDPLRPSAWVTLSVLAAVLPGVWASVKPAPPVPDVVSALYEPGKINVVEFADFECPYCRKLFPVLEHVMESYPKDRIHFVRKHVPLPMHEQALPAARAAVCAAKQGKGETLAERLMQIDLTPQNIHRAAIGVGVNADDFDHCLASKDPDTQIAADTALLEEAGMAGLPTTYVGGKRLLGAVSEAALRDAFDHAAKGDGEFGIPGVVFVPLALGVLAAIAWLGRSRRVKLPDGPSR